MKFIGGFFRPLIQFAEEFWDDELNREFCVDRVPGNGRVMLRGIYGHVVWKDESLFSHFKTPVQAHNYVIKRKHGWELIM